MNPPPLFLLNSFGGDWSAYESELYRIFNAELAIGNVQFRGCVVRCRRYPENAGKWASYWHLVQEGRIEADRLPDLRRCERIRWVRWVIENADSHPEINVWQNTRGSETNTLLWFREQYLVVLGRRTNAWLLKTAYCTDISGKLSKLRRERDANS
jgi:hypothetical protein